MTVDRNRAAERRHATLFCSRTGNLSAACQVSSKERDVSGDDDKARFASVVVPHLADAYALARWLTGDRADAEDVVQEASLRAFRAVGGFAGGNARAWVLTIVRHTAYSWLGKNRRPTVVAVGDLEAVEQAQAQAAADVEANSTTPGDRTDRQGRRRAARSRDRGAAGSIPRDAGVAGHSGSRLPRDRAGHRGAGRHRDVAAGARTPAPDRGAWNGRAMSDTTRPTERRRRAARSRLSRRRARSGQCARGRAADRRRSGARRRARAHRGVAGGAARKTSARAAAVQSARAHRRRARLATRPDRSVLAHAGGLGRGGDGRWPAARPGMRCGKRRSTGSPKPCSAITCAR